jgi:hypothetical protein
MRYRDRTPHLAFCGTDIPIVILAKTASASTALTEVPTKMKLTIDGTDGWGFDSLSLSLNGKTCDIVSGWLYTDASGEQK